MQPGPITALCAPEIPDADIRYRVDVVLVDTAWGGKKTFRTYDKGDTLYRTEGEARADAHKTLQLIQNQDMVLPEGAYEIHIEEGQFDLGASYGDGSYDSNFEIEETHVFKRLRIAKKTTVEIL